MADQTAPFRVELAIPPRPEFVGVARLSIARVASLMQFSFDDVEDIRLAVGEACTRAIERLGARDGDLDVRLVCQGTADGLSIEVHSSLSGPAASAPAGEEDLGSMLIQILVDELSEEERAAENTRVLRMVKHIAR